MKFKRIGYRVLISYYFASDGVWQNSDYTSHWNYKIYCDKIEAENAIKDMINSGKYSTKEKFKIEPLYVTKENT